MIIMAKKKVNGNLTPSREGVIDFWSDPPNMSESAKSIFETIKKRIPDPSAAGLEGTDIFDIVAYCEMQAWLSDRPLAEIADTQEYEMKDGRTKIFVNPELMAWSKISIQCQRLSHYLFHRKKAIAPPQDITPDPDILKADDFPISVRDAAKDAQKLLQGKDISKTMPFALKIGDKFPVRRG